MKTPDPAAAVLADRIMLTAPKTPGSNAVIGTVLPRVLQIDVVALGDDGHPQSAACAEQFARHAVHGGFATDSGFTWHRPDLHLHGRAALEQLLKAVGPKGHAATFTTEDGAEHTELRIYTGDGRQVTEQTGLADLRARLATGCPALPVNAHSTGTITDHRPKGNP